MARRTQKQERGAVPTDPIMFLIALIRFKVERNNEWRAAHVGKDGKPLQPTAWCHQRYAPGGETLGIQGVFTKAVTMDALTFPKAILDAAKAPELVQKYAQPVCLYIATVNHAEALGKVRTYNAGGTDGWKIAVQADLPEREGKRATAQNSKFDLASELGIR